MTYRRGAVIVLAAVGVGAWLAITTGLGISTPAPVAHDPPVVTSPLDPIIRHVQSQSGRLHAYLASRPPLAPPARDPFAFRDLAGQHAGANQTPALAGALASVLTALSVRPSLTLSGLAEDPSPDGPVCTAIISGMGQLFLVKEGETFGGRFQVVRIGAESVQVRDRTTESTFTLSLK